VPVAPGTFRTATGVPSKASTWLTTQSVGRFVAGVRVTVTLRFVCTMTSTVAMFTVVVGVTCTQSYTVSGPYSAVHSASHVSALCAVRTGLFGRGDDSAREEVGWSMAWADVLVGNGGDMFCTYQVSFAMVCRRLTYCWWWLSCTLLLYHRL
jgi:hypothetical protein